MSESLRVLELFSGIGGMRAAIKETGINFNIIDYYEINDSAVAAYSDNFLEDGESAQLRNIMSLSAADLNRLAVDLLVMSPPCQPFTRQGNKKDIDDNRCSPFLHILKALGQCTHIPKYILIENVAGFETSLAHECLIKYLDEFSYSYQEFMLTPSQFGIPNSRLRYYLLAKKLPLKFIFEIPIRLPYKIQYILPVCACFTNESLVGCNTCKKSTWSPVRKLKCLLPQSKCESQSVVGKLSNLSLSSVCCCNCSTLKPFLDAESNCVEYLIPYGILKKYLNAFDVVDINSKSSCCFTKGYGRYVKGTGSVLRVNTTTDMCNAYQTNHMNSGEDIPQIVPENTSLRYFTPREILNIMCFPQTYNIPSRLSRTEAYKLLGNSVNVYVVAVLLNLLLREKESTQ